MSDARDPSAGEPDEEDFVALKPGQTIGRYEVTSVLGQGGFGITYRARDGQLGREVAIKEYLPSALAVRKGDTTVRPRNTRVADDFGWGRDRFVSEGRTLATLHRAPAIVHVFDFLEANGTAYIVMELLSGETLEDRLKRDGRLGPADIDGILWPLLDGLEQVHAAGFLHRDIKPANVLLDSRGAPTLIDFGASRAAMADRTTAMTAIFTPGYAAAEQMTSAKQGPWTDIYGLSATLYHAITGSPPPSAFDRLLNDSYRPLAKSAPAGFSPGLCAGIDAGLAVSAAERPQNVAGWRVMLGLAAAPEGQATVVMGRPGSPSPLSVPASAPAPAEGPRGRGAWLAVAAIVAAAALGGGYYAYSNRGPDPETIEARALAEAAEAARLKAEQDAAQLRAEQERQARQQQEAAERRRLEEEAAERQRHLEDELRRRFEAEQAEKKRLEEEARRKQEEEIEARRRAIEFVEGDFGHFGRTLLMIGLAGRPDEIRLQGIDIVNDPALRQLAANALASQPRHLRCRQTDRLTDGTPLYRCLVTPLGAKAPLGQVPDSERVDLALALVRNGLVLASCDAPRSYADAEDEARGRGQSLWSRVKVQEYKRRCTR